LSKHALNKTIEARKLNKKTGVPIGGPEVTIPYGAFVEHPHRDGDMWRFTYNQELYRCAKDVLTLALDRGALKGIAEREAGEPGAPASERKTSDAVAPPESRAKDAAQPPAEITGRPSLRWETIASSHYVVLRTKVPGGWLVAAGAGPSLTFYPDPEHRWDGTSLD